MKSPRSPRLSAVGSCHFTDDAAHAIASSDLSYAYSCSATHQLPICWSYSCRPLRGFTHRCFGDEQPIRCQQPLDLRLRTIAAVYPKDCLPMGLANAGGTSLDQFTQPRTTMHIARIEAQTQRKLAFAQPYCRELRTSSTAAAHKIAFASQFILLTVGNNAALVNIDQQVTMPMRVGERFVALQMLGMNRLKLAEIGVIKAAQQDIALTLVEKAFQPQASSSHLIRHKAGIDILIKTPG